MWIGHLRRGERQLPIDGWPGYYVTNLGRVFSFKGMGRYGVVDLEKAPREKKPITMKSNRHTVAVVTLKAGRARLRVVHVARLVAEAFIGPKPAGLGVLHRDDDPFNNRRDNLRYGDQKMNARDRMRNAKKRVTTCG